MENDDDAVSGPLASVETQVEALFVAVGYPGLRLASALLIVWMFSHVSS